VYTDKGSSVYGYRVRFVRTYGHIFKDIGSDVAVQGDSTKTRAEAAYGVCNQRLKLKYDESLSNFGFNFNLRRYEEAAWHLHQHRGYPQPRPSISAGSPR